MSAPKVRVGELLPHLRRRPERFELLESDDTRLRSLAAQGDMVAALVLALKPGQRQLMRARLIRPPA